MEKAEVGTTASMGLSKATATDILAMIKNHDIKMVDCCFTDPLGTWNHCTFAANQIDAASFKEGLPFDASSIRLFREINESDMMMIPDPSTAWVDPFHKFKTLHLTCSIRDPMHPNEVYDRDPRTIAQKAVDYVKSTGIADTVFVGPEAEFFLFDNVRYNFKGHSAMFELDAAEAPWNSCKPGDGTAAGSNRAHRPEAKGYYFPVAPIDRHCDIRSEMLITMGELGLPIEKQHHEVAAAQSELGFRALPLLAAADALQTYKYVVKNVAERHGKSASFMPKPVFGDNGSGMHVHMSLWKGGKPLFYDAAGKFVGLSEMALHFIGGILKHAPALCALTNPTTNSYKRLVPGFEAPVNLVYSKGNRSAAIRIPMYQPNSPNAKRLEFRCPDPTSNPYLAFACILMAGMDGVKHKISPGQPCDVDIYELPEEELHKIPTTPRTLRDALEALKADHAFLLEGGVFTKSFLDSYIKLKLAEAQRMEIAPHPLEFQLYYHL